MKLALQTIWATAVGGATEDLCSPAENKPATKLLEYLALFSNPHVVLEYLPLCAMCTHTHAQPVQRWLSSLPPAKVSICIMQHTHPLSHMTLYQE